MKPLQVISNIVALAILMSMASCTNEKTGLAVTVFETSASGNQLTLINEFTPSEDATLIELLPNKTFQTITGFGGSFTESSAHLLNNLSKEKRAEVIKAYFSKEGADYSLTRTHMNSCDFSLSQYSYAPVENDTNLEHFSVKEDEDDIIPMIKEAMAESEDGFRIISSPWTAPPWMKDNKDWVGGKLLKEHYPTWALFFSKYIQSYKKHGIDIWSVTVENEPHGNGNNWESMHYTPAEMTDFVQNFLGPKLAENNQSNVGILGYDQNRKDLKNWVDDMYKNEESAKYFAGTAIHWYESTYEVFPEELQYAHNKAPDKLLIQTEACIDSEVPAWKDDAWYWKKEATDWGYDWREEENKYLHPKYAPVNRYARDIIGCLNNYVDGWVDWNMVLDKQGGPNWFKNWCAAPVIVDPSSDEVYYTPLYYVMSHFSKFIRPGAEVIGHVSEDEDLQIVAAKNPDESIAVVIFNEGESAKNFKLKNGGKTKELTINPQAIQSVVLLP